MINRCFTSVRLRKLYFFELKYLCLVAKQKWLILIQLVQDKHSLIILYKKACFCDVFKIGLVSSISCDSLVENKTYSVE